MKAMATRTIFLVLVIGMFIFFAIVIFYKWLDIDQCSTSKAMCAARRMGYCMEWWKNDQSFGSGRPEWKGDIEDCNRVGGESKYVPCPEPSADDCKEMLKKS